MWFVTIYWWSFYIYLFSHSNISLPILLMISGRNKILTNETLKFFCMITRESVYCSYRDITSPYPHNGKTYRRCHCIHAPSTTCTTDDSTHSPCGRLDSDARVRAACRNPDRPDDPWNCTFGTAVQCSPPAGLSRTTLTGVSVRSRAERRPN